MLVNVKTNITDPRMGAVLLAISGGRHALPTRQPGRGLYLINHFSFDHVCETPILEKYPEFPDLTLKDRYGIAGMDDETSESPNAYGVCDSPAQFMALAGDYLTQSPRAFAVSFTEISRAEQPSDGGWRWHKWGPYIGACKPTAEYLADERLIDRVFVYHVYEFKPEDVVAVAEERAG
jgi:hypothetical protein